MENNKKALLWVFLVLILLFVVAILFMYKSDNQIDQNQLQNIAMTNEEKVMILNSVSSEKVTTEEIEKRKDILGKINPEATSEKNEDRMKILENLNLNN